MGNICKNCGHHYEGHYCNECGQKAKTGKLTLRSVIDNWAYGLTNCDTGILFTYKELFTRPGHMLADYIRGKRVIYFQPFPMLFITAGLYGLLSEILVPPEIEQKTEVLTVAASFWERFYHLLSTWVHTSMSLTAILTLPLFAWTAQLTFPRVQCPTSPKYRQYVSLWLYHWFIHPRKNSLYQPDNYCFISTYFSRFKYNRRKKYTYNFTEYVFIFAYIACQRLVIGLLLCIPVLTYTHTSKLNTEWNLILYTLYFLFLIWDFKQLFGLSIFKATRKTVYFLLNLTALILFITFLAVAVIFSVLILCKYLNMLPADVILELGESL